MGFAEITIHKIINVFLENFPEDGTNGGLYFLASSMAGMIELSGNCPVFGNKLSCLSFADESAILDDDKLVPVFRRS